MPCVVSRFSTPVLPAQCSEQAALAHFPFPHEDQLRLLQEMPFRLEKLYVAHEFIATLLGRGKDFRRQRVSPNRQHSLGECAKYHR